MKLRLILKGSSAGQNGKEQLMPGPLYKFVRDVKAVQPILAGNVKFSPSAELNDPCEMVPPVIKDEVVTSLCKLRQNGHTSEDITYYKKQSHLFQKLAPEFMRARLPISVADANRQLKLSVYDDIPLLLRELEKFAQKISDKIGFFCLAQRYDSLPMWAHYAANAQGFVVEYRELHEVFCGDNTGILDEILPVRYERGLTGVTYDPRSYQTLFLAKFLDWSYEKEVRIVKCLNECSQVILDSKRHYFYQVDKKHIARIICGWQMSADNMRAINECRKSINSDVELNQVRLHRDQISITPLSIR
jgi:hypothetical protein